MFRLLHRLALVIVTLVCVGITSAGGRSIVCLTPDSVNADAVRRALPSEPSDQWRDGAECPVVELKAVEADADDGDPRCDVVDDAAVAFKGVSFPREAGRVLRGEPQIDTSRFALGNAGLARGPPV